MLKVGVCAYKVRIVAFKAQTLFAIPFPLKIAVLRGSGPLDSDSNRLSELNLIDA